MNTNPESQLMCKDCAWYQQAPPEKRGGVAYGYCHRYPASCSEHPWPSVYATDWCGEFSPNTDLAEEKLNPSGS